MSSTKQAQSMPFVVIETDALPNTEVIREQPLEVVLDDEFSENNEENDLEVVGPAEDELTVEDLLSDLPGAPSNTPEPQEPVLLEVSDKADDISVVDDESTAKAKKNEKWDWQSKGATGFLVWIKERVDGVPKHSGYDSAGLERAKSYLEKLDDEISKAMRLDLDGELDADKIEKVRAQIDDGISRIQGRLNKVLKVKKNKRKKSAEYSTDEEIVKQAQKITGMKGIYVTVPLLISGIARICINGTVSAGHELSTIYHDQCKKYNLNDREKAEVRWCLFDSGFPLRGDRGYLPDEEVDESSSDNYDWAANFKA